jgi:hypothetical protein
MDSMATRTKHDRHDGVTCRRSRARTIRSRWSLGLLALAAATLLVACGTPSAPTSGEPLLLWTFDDDLDGWLTGTTGDGWGSAEWRSWCGSERERGCVKLDGVGGAGSPNAWIYRTLTLPADATTLRFDTSAHNRDGADSLYRVRLVDASAAEHVLIPWAESSGSEDAYHWLTLEASIAAFAGTSVTLYFEGADNGPGSHEQRYYDDIGIY